MEPSRNSNWGGRGGRGQVMFQRGWGLMGSGLWDFGLAI